MVVKRKPSNVEAFIQEGGSISQPTTPKNGELENSEAEVRSLKLRLPADLLAEVDTSVKRRRPSPSRHQWILEAIYEKLERETTEDK